MGADSGASRRGGSVAAPQLDTHTDHTGSEPATVCSAQGFDDGRPHEESASTTSVRDPQLSPQPDVRGNGNQDQRKVGSRSTVQPRTGVTHKNESPAGVSNYSEWSSRQQLEIENNSQRDLNNHSATSCEQSRHCHVENGAAGDDKSSLSFVEEFPPIRNIEERAGYRDIFNRDYAEYMTVFGKVSAMARKFKLLEEKLHAAPIDSESYLAVEAEIEEEYRIIQADAEIVEARERHEHLRAKLAHIKLMVKEFDAACKKLAHDNRPPPAEVMATRPKEVMERTVASDPQSGSGRPTEDDDADEVDDDGDCRDHVDDDSDD
jgi:hypothetical protein